MGLVSARSQPQGARRRPPLVGLRYAVPLVILLLTLAGSTVAAHPLGNFTINTYSRLDFAAAGVVVTYALDYAEVPTLQLQQDRWIDRDGDGSLAPDEAVAVLDDLLPGVLAEIRFTIGDVAVPLVVLDRAASLVPGQGGLPTLRIDAHFGAPLPQGWRDHGAAYYADANFHDRLGWREIVVRGGAGVAVEGAANTNLSDGLRTFPEDRLNSPPNMYQVDFSILSGAAAPATSTQPTTTTTAQWGGLREWLDMLTGGGAIFSLAALTLLLLALVWDTGRALVAGRQRAQRTPRTDATDPGNAHPRQ